MEWKQGVGRTSPDRTHNYIDIENLVCRGKLSADDVAWARVRYEAAVSPGGMDLFTVGCDVANAFAVRQGFPGARIVWGRGPNGADLALIEAVHGDMRHGLRVARVTIGSGDHIFAPVLAELARCGASTRVVGVDGHMSAKLRLAAHDTMLLPDNSLTPMYEWSA